MSCIAMPVETDPDWFQPLPLCCLGSGTFHSLGEEKAHGSGGRSSSPETLHGIRVPGTQRGRQPQGWLQRSASAGKGFLALSGLQMDPRAPSSAALCFVIIPR